MGVHHSKGRRKRSKSIKKDQNKKEIQPQPLPATTTSTTTATTTETASTTISISDGSDINNNNSPPDNNDQAYKQLNGASLRQSVYEGEPRVEIEPEHDHDHESEEQQGCMLCDVQADKFYSLEVCGHGFCIPCIFAYAEEKLNALPEDCCEVLCPLQECGCAVSTADLKTALTTFGYPGLQRDDGKAGSSAEVKPAGESSKKGGGSGSSGEDSSSAKPAYFPIQLTQSLETLLSKNSNYIRCPNPQCKFVFERLPPERSHEVVLDEHGNPLSSVALKHRQLNRFRCRVCDNNFCAGCKTIPYHVGFTCKAYFQAKVAKHCRFCDVALPASTKPHESCIKHSPRTTTKREKARSLLSLKWKSKEKTLPKSKGKLKGSLDETNIDDLEGEEMPKEFYVCTGYDCKSKMRWSCQRWLECSHFCRGVINSACLCLEPDCTASPQNGDDYCAICWVEALKSAPTIKLGCGHYFHYACVKKKLTNKWPGPSISFAFATCPLCQELISHSLFDSDMGRINVLRLEVKARALDRLKIEGLLEDTQVMTEGSKFYNNPGDYAVHIFSFYECHLCKHPYFGGRRQCEVEAENVDMSKHNPAELICPACSTINAECRIHGREYIDFKCRFCCSLATYFCGGKAHFCTPCHDKAGQLVEFTNWTTIAKCAPCKGPGECPLAIPHAENGQEFAMGCSMCRAAEKQAEEVVV